ncbi:hypothetical protein [Achromobacter deleyi]|uniref:hypothetical protein n=1 Tax=Achromobacter deleyi TaxID=1353891 RepID=UPI0014928B50|nr:hypothetical protein [Achromobacter deleyi]QVQ26830.1 hypothetical protein HLG70_29135 [Achromobacter deleyi]UIP22406.1 hypothetical protein LYZ39_07810 [Achromobacter deleyi]
MRTALGAACALAALLWNGGACAQYVVQTQDMSGRWSVPHPHYQGVPELFRASSGAKRACLDRGPPSDLYRATKVIDLRTGEEVLLVDCIPIRKEQRERSEQIRANAAKPSAPQ